MALILNLDSKLSSDGKKLYLIDKSEGWGDPSENPNPYINKSDIDTIEIAFKAINPDNNDVSDWLTADPAVISISVNLTNDQDIIIELEASDVFGSVYDVFNDGVYHLEYYFTTAGNNTLPETLVYSTVLISFIYFYYNQILLKLANNNVYPLKDKSVLDYLTYLNIKMQALSFAASVADYAKVRENLDLLNSLKTKYPIENVNFIN
jgi:hypothetical protein